MKQYKVQELVGNTKKLPHTEKLFYETLINFRKLPECAQLFLPLQLQAHFKCRRKHHCSHCEKSDLKENNDLKRQCSRDEKEMQSYAEWKYFMTWMKLSSVKNFRRLRRSTVYILPIGPFPEGILCSLVSPQMTFLQSLTTFGEAFFPGLCFKVLPEIEFKEIGCNTRIHKKTGQLQILLPDLMQYLSKVAPKNAIGIVGLSWIDFYPGEDWNHILGEGSPQNGCAAFSFGHYGMFSNVDSHSLISSKGYPSPSVTHSVGSGKSEAISKISRENHEDVKNEFIQDRYRKSLLNETSRQKATSCVTLNGSRKSSTISVGGPLTRSSSSYRNLGSLSSIENSWTKVFSRSVQSFGSNSSVDDASYEIIDRGEADNYLASHGMEEDVIKLGLPIGCSFTLSCRTMWRMFKAIAHELCHIFGLSHCSFYECAMNSSRLVSEVDEQPLFLCPICLRKLQKFLKFRLTERYRRMRDVLQRMQPCYCENISLSRDYYDEIGDDELCHIAHNEVTEIVDHDNVDELSEGSSGRTGGEPAGHICIEVTREKSEGYDIINVEYKQRIAKDSGYKEHECQFSEALNKLDDIISFLNRK